jgi:hypothetical protein
MSEQKTLTTLPAVPTPEQSLALSQVAAKLYKSGLYPQTGGAEGAFAIVQYGAELGVGPMMSLQNIDLIKGKPAANSQLMLALALARGVKMKVTKETVTGCTIQFKRGDIEYTATFDEEDARAAGLVGKDNWKRFPKDMYYWRAVTRGVRRVAPEAVMGLYTVEELTDGEWAEIDEKSPSAPRESASGPNTEASQPDSGEVDYEKALQDAKTLGEAKRVVNDWLLTVVAGDLDRAQALLDQLAEDGKCPAETPIEKMNKPQLLALVDLIRSVGDE